MGECCWRWEGCLGLDGSLLGWVVGTKSMWLCGRKGHGRMERWCLQCLVVVMVVVGRVCKQTLD
jgi:hypothetical protein